MAIIAATTPRSTAGRERIRIAGLPHRFASGFGPIEASEVTGTITRGARG